jgi:hypothetical protein
VQDLSHDLEEIAKPSCSQSLPDGNFSFPFTQMSIPDVRVRDLTTIGIVGIPGDHRVGICPTQFIQIEQDFKFPQVGALQFDGFGGDADLTPFQVIIDIVKLVEEPPDLAVQET